MQQELSSIDTQYDQSLKKIQQLNELLQKLANKQSLEDLVDQTTPQDYMELLASMIYSLHSTMFCYSHIKNQEMPEEFKKVKQYYSKIKDTLAGKIPHQQKNPLKIDKQAAMRMIKSGVKQVPSSNERNV